MTSLPTPSADAIEHSQTLIASICDAIKTAGGILPFDQYMQACLYTPGLGYYQAGCTKFGESGDFVTAPEISPLFGQCIAKQLIPTLQQLEAPIIFELGAGTGKLAAKLLLQLQDDDALPEAYSILEPSPDLQKRQRELLTAKLPNYIDKISWRDSLPRLPFNGVIIANEVMDAMPVKRFKIANGTAQELGVMFDGQRFQYQTFIPENLPTIIKQLASSNLNLPEHYITEVNIQLKDWLHGVTKKLQNGLVLFFDYGYAEREYYRPERNAGTLSCYYRHHQHDDPFVYPGLQDITSHVDFSLVATAGLDCGFDLAGYTSQALFLAANGIDALAAKYLENNPKAAVQVQSQLKQLLLPQEMGELVKVIALTKNLKQDNFKHWADLRHNL